MLPSGFMWWKGKGKSLHLYGLVGLRDSQCTSQTVNYFRNLVILYMDGNIVCDIFIFFCKHGMHIKWQHLYGILKRWKTFYTAILKLKNLGQSILKNRKKNVSISLRSFLKNSDEDPMTFRRIITSSLIKLYGISHLAPLVILLQCCFYFCDTELIILLIQFNIDT